MFTYFKRSVHSIAEYKEMENRMIQRIVEQCFAKENCFFDSQCRKHSKPFKRGGDSRSKVLDIITMSDCLEKKLTACNYKMY